MGVYTFKPDRYSSHTKIINYIKSLADRKLKILDVGCSKGFIGKSLKSNKIEFCGIDYNREHVSSYQPF